MNLNKKMAEVIGIATSSVWNPVVETDQALMVVDHLGVELHIGKSIGSKRYWVDLIDIEDSDYVGESESLAKSICLSVEKYVKEQK